MKMLIQEVWRAKLDWDEELSEPLKCQFQKLASRFVKPSARHSSSMPSKERAPSNPAMKGSTYLLSWPKTHVAPLKQLSIPRLELQGAVEALHLAILICREMNLDLSQITFHVDSQTVLRWIHSAKIKYEVFVGNRTGKILMPTVDNGATFQES
ncbi:uncharacterized protein LOC130687575 [Daphnia carinata]|uniref:uncharacterized protein LOC130687575 n=1 Tax=Daphnia carinata TaxID=120202 RepID=UPI00257B8D33|nr:uncharacterized protein LOC130687575 [Daphnia carinata]